MQQRDPTQHLLNLCGVVHAFVTCAWYSRIAVVLAPVGRDGAVVPAGVVFLLEFKLC